MLQGTSISGICTELLCMHALIARGISVSIPYGNSDRYDFIIDYKGSLYRVQCKTSKKEQNNSYSFYTKNIQFTASRKINKPYTKEQIDLFCTFIDGDVYLIPVELCGLSKKYLRNELPKLGTKSKCSLLKEYTVESILNIN